VKFEQCKYLKKKLTDL